MPHRPLPIQYAEENSSTGMTAPAGLAGTGLVDCTDGNAGTDGEIGRRLDSGSSGQMAPIS